MLPRRDNPFLNSASILDALGIAYKAIKELTAKKPPQPPAPTYSKKAQITLSFPSQDAAGSEVTMDAVVKIRPGGASVLEF
jgi:hypothetical protein